MSEIEKEKDNESFFSTKEINLLKRKILIILIK